MKSKIMEFAVKDFFSTKRKTIAGVFASVALVAAGSVQAAALTFDFESVPVGTFVGASYGAPGVEFSAGDWFAISHPACSPSLSTCVILPDASGFVNVLDGFVGSFTFDYGSFVGTHYEIYDGLSGTGTLLGTCDFGGGISSPSCGFTGVAYSLKVFADNPSASLWDNLSFTTPAQVPLPGTFGLLGIGLAGLGLVRRKKA